MAVPIYIPKLGMTMSEATIVEWHAAEGAFLEKDGIALTIETEKVTWNIPADAPGFLHILVEKGKIAKVGEIVGQLAETNDELQALQKKGAAAGETVSGPPETESRQAEAGTGTADSPKPQKAAPASPAARSMAKKLGVDLSLVTGSGPNGRITEQDIVKYRENKSETRITPLAKAIASDKGVDISGIKGTGDRGKITSDDVRKATEPPKQDGAPSSGITVIPVTGMRKLIAGGMYESIQKTAQLSVFNEVDVTGMLEFHQQVREKYRNTEDARVTHTDIMVMATCRALKRFPIMNSTFTNDEILLYDWVHMGIAVSVSEGLIVPTLKNADRKSLLEIARERKALVEKARDGKLLVDDVVGGTFTISNFSMYNADGATPILRRPESGILAFGGIKKKPAVYRDALAIRSMMVVSLTFDHQVTDGAEATQFLKAVCEYLENPSLMVL
ncbi:MAG TPA: dihydrolipoamide acetyltransferase family protein [Syntrophales bacterium]|nr:dihydrolipoamide acetyltransferase family protein [Syntrophales bacterium]